MEFFPPPLEAKDDNAWSGLIAFSNRLAEGIFRSGNRRQTALNLGLLSAEGKVVLQPGLRHNQAGAPNPSGTRVWFREVPFFHRQGGGEEEGLT